jgi:hypothetical protein
VPATIRTQAQPEALEDGSETAEGADFWEKLVSLNFASWNQIDEWLRQLDELRRAA